VRTGERTTDLLSGKVTAAASPEILQGVPKVVVRALDPTDALHAAIRLLRLDDGLGALIALGGLDSYFQAARRQQQRIERAKRTVLKGASTRLQSLFDELHFYLICWARIAKLSRFIAQATRFRRAGRVLRRYHADLDARVDARHHLEHFEERLPGHPRRVKLAIPGDLLNMHGDFLTYGGKRIDIGPASLRQLKTIVTEFRAAVLYDSIEAIALADLNRAAGLLRRAASKVHLARVMKQWQGMLRSGETHATDTTEQ
jgi:hypothetical protein